MKKFFVIILTSLSLISCTKQVSKPSGAANQNTFFKNANVAVSNMSAVLTAGNNVTVSFSTAFENNISRIELMSGTSTSTFCTAQGVDENDNSLATKNYSFNDSNLKGSTMYYMLRFRDNNGNWSYSPYLSVKVN